MSKITLRAQKGHNQNKRMNKHDKIFDPCELASDFLTHVNEDKKLCLTLVDSQLVFLIHIGEEK